MDKLNFQDPITSISHQLLSEPHPNLTNVEVQFLNTKTHKFILKNLSDKVAKTKNLSNLYPNIVEFYQKLDEFKIYKKMDVHLLPDQFMQNAIKVQFNLTERQPYFASVSHMADTNSGAIMEAKAGLRNLFGCLDNTSIEMTKSLNSKLKKQAYQFNQEFPIFYKDISLQLGYIYGEKQIKKGIQEEYSQQFIKFNKNLNSLLLQNSNRLNNFDNENMDGYFNEIDYSSKFSASLVNNIHNSIYKRRRYKGSSLSLTTELTLPTSQSQFLKFQLQSRVFKSYKSLKKFSKRLYKNTNFEHNFFIGAIFPLYNQPLKVNDKFFLNQCRGFEEIDDSFGNEFILKHSTKWIFYDFPVFQEQKTVSPFWHANFQYASDFNHFNFKNLRFSAGLGLAMDVALGVRLELLYNILHLNQKNDIKNNLQIRVSLND